MRKSAVEKLREANSKKRGVAREIRGTHLVADLATLMLGGEPRPTQLAVLEDPTEDIAYMGHAGAAKTATGVCKILMRAILEPGSRFLITRKDGNDLKTTTMTEAKRQIDNLPPGTIMHRVKEDPETWTINCASWLGVEGMSDEPSEVIFAGLETLDLGSLNINGFMLDEADEIESEDKVLTLMGRCRNKGGSPQVTIMCFNGPPEEHWLYTACTGKNSKGKKVKEPYLKLYVPKPRENETNVKAGYYDRLEKLYADNPALLARLVEGKWVGHFTGVPVYPMFREHLHCRDDIPFEPTMPLCVGMDFGFNQPRAIYGQVDGEGRLHILAETVKQQMEIRPFLALVRAEMNLMFPGCEALWYGDSAVRQKKDTGSTLAILAQEGVNLQYRMMELDPSIRTVRGRLNMLVSGEPGLIINRRLAPILVSALKGGYRMADNGLKPFKDGYYDNSADALRYLVVNLFGLDDAEANAPNTPGGTPLPASAEYDPRFDTEGEHP